MYKRYRLAQNSDYRWWICGLILNTGATREEGSSRVNR